MASAGLAADGQPASSERGSALEQRKILIVYGSETGNSQEAAEDLERMAMRLHFETDLFELNEVKPVTLTQYPLVVVVLSTTGQGELPRNASVFWKQLLNRHLPLTCLRHVKFTTFGLGDSSYSKFNWAARKLHKRLEQLGATEFFPRGEADERHDEGIDGAYLPWSLSLRTHLLSEYPLPEGLEPIPPHVRLPPKILLEMADQDSDRPVQNGDMAVNLIDIMEFQDSDKPVRKGDMADHLSDMDVQDSDKPVRSNGLADQSNGLAVQSSGLADRSNGLAGQSSGLADRSNGLAGQSNGLAGQSNGLADQSNGLADQSNGLADQSNGLADHLKAAQFSHLEDPSAQNREAELKEERAASITYQIARQSDQTKEMIRGRIDLLDRPNMLKDTPSKYALEDGPSEANLPPPTLLPIPDAVHVIVHENKRVTPKSHWQDVRLLTLHATGNEEDELLNINVGDSVVLYPKNFPADVQALIDLMGWNHVADRPFAHSLAWSAKKDGIAIEHAPRNCYVARRSTLRDLLLHNYDITAIPTRSFFVLAQSFTEDAAHKTRLAEFGDPKFTDEFWDYTSRPRRSILEVLCDFPSVKIPYQWIPAMFPVIRGREYSIASGGEHIQEPNGSIARIELLVALVKYKTILRKTRQGLASRYIDTLAPGTPLHIRIQAHPHPPLDFLQLAHLPRPLSTPTLRMPVLAIATGTGIAPIRAYFAERHFFNPNAPNILFYGGRSKFADFYFAEEWMQKRVEVYTAFSRDQKEKIYVQDVIRLEYQRICDLFNQNAILCVCGSAGKMPLAVRSALRDALMRGGLAHTEAAAEGILRKTYTWEEVW